MRAQRKPRGLVLKDCLIVLGLLAVGGLGALTLFGEDGAALRSVPAGVLTGEPTPGKQPARGGTLRRPMRTFDDPRREG